MSRAALSLLLSLSSSLAVAHGIAEPPAGGPGERAIEFPDPVGFQTLVVDLHTHTVFSDGHVWPRTRVEEAQRDGLDALAITDHLEWQPHRADIPHPDRNRSYDEAVASLGDADLIVIRGSEITREPPAGHINAVFITDANALLRPPTEPVDLNDARAYYDAVGTWPAQEAVQIANAQGAFVFWNHPYWTRQKPDGIARINAFHRDNAKAGLLHGIEVANGQDYSEEAFQIALDYDLAMIGVSDVHNLVDWDYQPYAGGHRPVTLVFTTERSAAALRDALFERRTVVWFKNLLIGRPGQLEPLLAACLSVTGDGYQPDTTVATVTIANDSDARFLLANRSDYTFMGQADLLEIPPHGSLTLDVKPGGPMVALDLEFDVVNALAAPKQPARVRYRVALPAER